MKCHKLVFNTIEYNDETLSPTEEPLRGLKAAAQVAKSLEGSLALGLEENIIEQFNGDKQLAIIWKYFVLHNKWITINSQGRYVITEKGNQRIRRILQLLVAALLIPAATLSIDLESLTIPLF
jgi:hypothetical protein